MWQVYISGIAGVYWMYSKTSEQQAPEEQSKLWRKANSSGTDCHSHFLKTPKTGKPLNKGQSACPQERLLFGGFTVYH